MKNEKVRLPITLKLWKNGKMVHQSVCMKKTQILARTRGTIWDKAYIKVTYGKELWNDSDHYHQANLENALNAYFENNLINHARRSR